MLSPPLPGCPHPRQAPSPAAQVPPPLPSSQASPTGWRGGVEPDLDHNSLQCLCGLSPRSEGLGSLQIPCLMGDMRQLVPWAPEPSLGEQLGAKPQIPAAPQQSLFDPRKPPTPQQPPHCPESRQVSQQHPPASAGQPHPRREVCGSGPAAHDPQGQGLGQGLLPHATVLAQAEANRRYDR